MVYIFLHTLPFLLFYIFPPPPIDLNSYFSRYPANTFSLPANQINNNYSTPCPTTTPHNSYSAAMVGTRRRNKRLLEVNQLPGAPLPWLWQKDHFVAASFSPDDGKPSHVSFKNSQKPGSYVIVFSKGTRICSQ